MPALGKTSNIGLNDWTGNEYPKRLDFKEDNEKIDAAFGNLEDPELIEEMRGMSVAEMIKYLQSKVLEEDTALTVSLTKELSAESTSSAVENGQGVKAIVNGSFVSNYAFGGKMNTDSNGDGVVDKFYTAKTATTVNYSLEDNMQKIELVNADLNQYGDVVYDTSVGSFLEGDVVSLSVDTIINDSYEIKSRMSVSFRDSGGTIIGGFTTVDNLSLSKERITIENLIAPANTSFVRVNLRAQALENSANASAWFGKLQVEKSTLAHDFVEGIQPLRNVKLSCVGNNLVKYEGTVMGFLNGITGDFNPESTNRCTSEFILVKPNTEYKSANFGDFIFQSRVWYNSNKDLILSGGSLSPLNAKYVRYVFKKPDDSDFTIAEFMSQIEKPMIIEGTTVPPEYKTYVESKSTIGGWWGNGDTLNIDADGRVCEDRINEFLELDGSLDWTFSADRVGFKVVTITPLDAGQNFNVYPRITKFDNRILKAGSTSDGSDYFGYGNWFIGALSITIADTDSGWGEDYTPTTDEIKAYFNGWIMSDFDGNLYTNGNKFWRKRYQGIGVLVTLVFGAMTESGTVTVANATPISKAYDDITQDYKMYYELATSVTRELTSEKGISTHSGEICTFSVESGIVENEKPALSVIEGVGGYIAINATNVSSYPTPSLLDLKPKKILNIFREQLVNGSVIKTDDTSNWTIGVTEHPAWWNGVYAYKQVDDYDHKEIYYVDYLIEDDNQQVNAEISYKQNTHDAISYVNQAISRICGQQSQNTMRIAELIKPEEIFYPTLLNGWVNYISTDRAVVSYWMDSNGYVWINGAVKSGVTGTVVFILPEGYRPAKRLAFSISTSNGNGRLDVRADTGEILVSNLSDTLLVNMQISFKAGR